MASAPGSQVAKVFHNPRANAGSVLGSTNADDSTHADLSEPSSELVQVFDPPTSKTLVAARETLRTVANSPSGRAGKFSRKNENDLKYSLLTRDHPCVSCPIVSEIGELSTDSGEK